MGEQKIMISVIMGIHRIDQFVDEAINSILNQSLKEFELIIVANGKDTDNIKKYINENFTDPRIVMLSSRIGQLAYALNLAIDNSKYDYIARMDSDDVSMPNRLQQQLEYLTKNNLDMIGSAAKLIDGKSETIGIRYCPTNKAIDRRLPYRSTFIHPSIFIKKQIILDARGYNSGFNSEDYDLWLRLNRKNINWDNMNIPLIKYRIHQNSSQGNKLGYAECAGYAVREFILRKSISSFLAMTIQFLKAFIKSIKQH